MCVLLIQNVVVMIDLDNFKPINDTYGHNTGDEALKRVAKALTHQSRYEDVIARLGGDEFIIILSRVTDVSVLDRLATNLIQQIGEISVLS